MRVALISDIHGNAVALATCLKAIRRQGVDEFYFLGDAVGYYPGEQRVLELLDEIGSRCQQGNHEAMLLDPESVSKQREVIYQLAGARQRLTPGEFDLIGGWPDRREVDWGGRSALLVHANPNIPLTGYVYADFDFNRYADVPYDAIFMAHTHHPFSLSRAGKLFVNVGSIGMPRDQGDLASFALYDTESGSCRICRVRLDREAIAATYGHKVHASVMGVLARKGPDPVGELLE